MIWYVLTPVLTLLFANTGKRFIWRTEPFIQHVDPQQLRSRHQSSCTGPWISMVSKSCQVRPSVIFQRRVGYLFCLERLGGGFASNKKNIQTKIVHAFPDSKMNGLFNHANPPWCLWFLKILLKKSTTPSSKRFLAKFDIFIEIHFVTGSAKVFASPFSHSFHGWL